MSRYDDKRARPHALACSLALATALAGALLAPIARADEPRAIYLHPRVSADGSRATVTLRDGQSLHSYARYRSNWYVGFGLGGGAGQVADQRGYALSASAGMVTSVRLGWVALPWLLLGGELAVWSAPQARWRQLYHGDAVATIFPFEDIGLYTKAGVGAGLALLREEGTGAGLRTDLGFDLRGALGYELQLGSSLNVGIEVCYARTGYAGGAAQDLAGSLTFVWY